MVSDKCNKIWDIPRDLLKGDDQRRRVYLTNGLSPVLLTPTGGYFETKILMKGQNMAKKLRIRKLTEGECYRLMGFQEKDPEACKSVGQSKANIYHQAGDSIVTTVLVGMFGELLNLDYHKAISDYADGLHAEVE